MSIQFHPNKFNLQNLKSRSSYLIIGEKHSGKSTLIKELIHHFDKDCNINTGFIYCNSKSDLSVYNKFCSKTFIYNDINLMLEKVINRQKQFNKENQELIHHFDKDCNIKTGFIYCNSKSDLSVYNKFCSKTFIYNDFNLMLEKAINRQEQFNKEYKEGKKEIYKKYSSLLIVIDDIIDMSLLTNNTNFNNIIYNGHYYNITLIISIQSVNILPSNVRQNNDIIFLFNTDNEREIRKIYDSFGGMFPSEKIFKSVLQDYTKDYQALILDMTKGPSASLNDRIKTYKADINLKYDKFGNDDF